VRDREDKMSLNTEHSTGERRQPGNGLQILYAVVVLVVAYVLGKAAESTFAAILVIAAGIALRPLFGGTWGWPLITAGLLVAVYLAVTLTGA
jgi:hypothetical protein